MLCRIEVWVSSGFTSSPYGASPRCDGIYGGCLGFGGSRGFVYDFVPIVFLVIDSHDATCFVGIGGHDAGGFPHGPSTALMILLRWNVKGLGNHYTYVSRSQESLSVEETIYCFSC